MITILGGGVAGASLAWGLARRGHRKVTVLDPRQPAEGSTGAALGGFRTQHGSALNIGLSLASRPWFEARADRIDFQPNGYLYLGESAEVAVELARRAELQLACGLPIEHPEPRSLVPFLDDRGYQAANFCALDGLYLPALVLGAFREEAASAGVVFRYGADAPRAEAGDEATVVCAGTWSGEVGRDLGVELRVEAVARRVWDAGRFEWLARRPVPMTLEAGSGYHFRERAGSLLVMGPGEQEDWTHFQAWLERRVPAAATATPAGGWTGSYEVTFDQHPLVGPTERPGVWASCGFSGHGVMHAPAVGDALAAMILGDSPPLDLSALSPLRTEPLQDSTQV